MINWMRFDARTQNHTHTLEDDHDDGEQTKYSVYDRLTFNVQQQFLFPFLTYCVFDRRFSDSPNRTEWQKYIF